MLSTETRRSRLVGLALLVMTFLVGGLAGAAFTQVLNAREPAPAEATTQTCGAHGRHRETALIEQLDLTPEQRTRVDSILERRRSEAHAFWESEGKRLQTIVDSTRLEVSAVLTPQQQARYDALRAELKRQRAAADSANRDHPHSKQESGR
jgi:Spy/CpxP family protein refolding chaperone